MNFEFLKNKKETGILLAVIATLIWSGNFIIARGVTKLIPPISLSFFRWLCATIILFPFIKNSILKEWVTIKNAWSYLFWISFSGIALFNTFVYLAGHYSSAINLALIGTTASPIIAIILSKIFLKEKIGWQKFFGVGFCVSGILLLLSKGSFQNLLQLRFTKGDTLILIAAFCFAVYNTLVKNKPKGITSLNFLFAIFAFGTILLSPFFIIETAYSEAIKWDLKLISIIIYLGMGTSVISFLFWNIAISKLGAGRTALFGNLIPIFTTIEAVFFLGEIFSVIHIVSMILVFVGIAVANWKVKTNS